MTINFATIQVIVGLFVFLYGISIGSFLNVVIYRIPLRKSVSKGRSYCPICATTLKWYDLVPIISYITLKGKCRSCGAQISQQYPIVESITGIGFVLLYLYFGFNLGLFISLTIWCSFVATGGIVFNKIRNK